MIDFIILIAKYCIFAPKYKMQRLTVEGFLKILHQRNEAEHYIALAKDKIEQIFGRLRIGFVLPFCFFV